MIVAVRSFFFKSKSKSRFSRGHGSMGHGLYIARNIVISYWQGRGKGKERKSTYIETVLVCFVISPSLSPSFPSKLSFSFFSYILPNTPSLSKAVLRQNN